MYKTKPIQYSTSPYRQSNLYQTPNSSRYSSPIYPSHKTLVSQEDNTSQNPIKPQAPLFSSTSEPSFKIVHKQGPLSQSSFADLKPKLSYDLTFSNSSTKNVGLDSQELQTTSRKNKSIYSRTDINTCISVSELRGFPEQFSQNSHRIPTDVNSYGEVSSRLSIHSSPLQSYPGKKGITTTSYPNKLFLSDESPSTEFRDNIHNFPHTTNNIRGAKISFLQKGDLQTNSNNFLVSKAQEGKKVEPFMKSQSIDFAQMRPL